MKILFISKGDLPDLQCDTIFHGGRSLFGDDFVDVNRAWYMYKKDRLLYWNERVPNGGNSYGLGFYLNGTMPEDPSVDRTDILSKIKNRFFDCVIYGSATRCLDYLNEVRAAYPPTKILFVDGEDNNIMHRNYLDMGHLFKRELIWPTTSNLHAIQFGTPKEKIVKDIPEKTREYATVVPGDLSTYIFKTEKDFYNDYQISYFGITMKKGGWDCGRHYEILMNACVPYFPDIRNCPTYTMTKFPKEKITLVSDMLQSENPEFSEEWYLETVTNLLNYTKNELTTENVVRNMLNYINE